MSDVQVNVESASFFNENDNTFRYTGFNMDNFTVNSKTIMVTFETVDGKINEKYFTETLGLLNGKRTEVKFAASNSNAGSVSIYPNPSRGQFAITTEVDGQIDIVDMTGNLVFNGSIVKANQMLEVNLNGLSAGVYFVRFYSENTVQTKRVVICE